MHRMTYGTRPSHLQHQKAAIDMFPARLRAWRERGNLSQSEAALRLQISKRTLQEWEQGRAAPHVLARSAVENALRVQRASKKSV
jgi:DNA-binding transcriptional regulator YiaG